MRLLGDIKQTMPESIPENEDIPHTKKQRRGK